MSTCLIGALLAVTVLRPRTEVLPPTITEWHGGSTPVYVHSQITHRWSLYPPRQWRFTKYGCRGISGWQYGPFAFQKRDEVRSWPVAVEK